MIAHNLHPVGVSFYREVWSEHVTQIYRSILSKRVCLQILDSKLMNTIAETPEETFGRPKRVDRLSKASYARISA